MDRHQYVKGLIEQRDAKRQKKLELSANVAKAKARTKEAVLDYDGERLATLSDVSSYAFVNGSECSSGIAWKELAPENERVSDEAIHALHIEIHQLDAHNEKLEVELKDLQRQDFVSHLQRLLNS